MSSAGWRCWLVIGAGLGFGGCGDGTLFLLGGNDLSDDAGSDASQLPEAGLPDGSTAEASFCATGEPVTAPLKALLDELVGYGEAATGGADGCMYHVTNSSDDGAPGSLRYGLMQPDPLWIVFDVNANITLLEDIVPASNKTIDARERQVTIYNHGLHIVDQQNIIITNVAFVGQQDGEVNDLDDAITIVGSNARNIWIHRCSFSRYADGLIDIYGGATDVTISWSHFFDHKKVMLFGNDIDDEDARNMRVTLHHNRFNRTETYHPRIRFGHVHMFNNLLEAWRDYGAAASHFSELLSESNIYSAGTSEDAITIRVTSSDDEPGNARSVGDLPLNGAVLLEDDTGNDPSQVDDPPYAYTLDNLDADAGADASIPLLDSIVQGAGVDVPRP